MEKQKYPSFLDPKVFDEQTENFIVYVYFKIKSAIEIKIG